MDVDTGIEHRPRGDFCALCGDEVAPGALVGVLCDHCNAHHLALLFGVDTGEWHGPEGVWCAGCGDEVAPQLVDDGLCEECHEANRYDDGGTGELLDLARDMAQADAMEAGW